jgi:pyruvate dehydrogenase E2 component (dihydrolipoamide acetyltransferase)
LASEVVMPRLGWTMEVGTVVEWLKGDGDAVEAGEFIFSVESDKAITEVEALDSGILRIPPDSPIGIEVPVGATLAFIAVPGEEVSFAAPSATPAVASAAPAAVLEQVPTAPVGAGGNGHRETPAISPRARRAADRLGVDWTVLIGSGSTGRVRERDVLAAVSARPALSQPRATPLVRRLADEAGVDLGYVAASGPAGRITRGDVLAAAAAEPAPVPGTATPLSPIRRVIVQRMTESARTVAPVTLTTEADATELARVREHLKTELAGSDEAVPSFTDLLVRLSALALREHPAVNASLSGDAIVQHAAIHVGVAVDTDRGLLVPVVRDADRKSAGQIAAETAILIAQTRAGTASANDLRGSTFTVSNLGMFEIDAFTPIINLPEAAILGLGRIVARPVVIDEAAETIAVRKMMALSLTFDHRIVDGAPAARFLQRIKRMIEQPYAPLMR